MLAVGAERELGGRDGLDGAEGVALDAGDLDQARDRVARCPAITARDQQPVSFVRGVNALRPVRRDEMRTSKAGRGDAPRQCSMPISAAASMISGEAP